MDRKLDAGALIVAAAAVLLVVALFLPWFGLGRDDGVSAWRVFEALDLVLVGACAAAVAAAFGRLDSRVLLGAALLAVIVVASQLLDPPPAARGAEREVGAWLALVGAAGLMAGAALAAAQIAVTVDVRGRERRRRVATVDKRGTAPAPAPPRAQQQEPVVDRFAPEPATRAGSQAVDTGATQPFTPPSDDAIR